MTPKVGIVLINYRDYADRFLVECRDSLRLQNYPSSQFTVYIVDNVTNKETQERLHILYPEAFVVPTEGNGWGHGNNLGAETAFADGCGAVVFANMDTIFEVSWLSELVKVGERDDVGIAQSLVVLHPPKEGKDYLNSTGNVVHFLGFGYCENYGVAVEQFKQEEISDIGYASGVALYIRKEVFQKVGGCDEQYFMYHDDLELSLKVKSVGLRVVLAPKSIVRHKYEFNRSVKQLYYIERNRYITLLTFYKIPTLLLSAPAFLFMEMGMWAYAIKSGWFKIKFSIFVYFCRVSSWKKILDARKKIQTKRIISDGELLRCAKGRIEFQKIENPVLKYVANPILNAYWTVAKKLIIW